MTADAIQTNNHVKPRLSIWLMRLGMILMASFVPIVTLANPLKTDDGRTIRNLEYFPNGVTVNNIQFLPPGWALEDGSGPPGKVLAYVPSKEWTDAEKKKINDDNKKAFPKIKVVGDPTKVYDCHGFTFKSKKMRISNDDVDKIVKDQGWKPAGDGKHKKGDIIIYRDKAGKVTHSGIVEEVGADGNVAKVSSKWGASGEYVHDVKDVPSSYGTKTEVRTGGKALADPPIAPEDVNVFHGLLPPPLKANLFDPFVAPVVEGYISFNALPNPELVELTHGPEYWDYGLDIPQLGLQVSPGDTLILYGDRWVGASISSIAMSTNYGGWIAETLLDSIVFSATSSAFIPGDFSGLITGFTGISSPSIVGDIVYTEAIAGSIGLVSGPIPEPGTFLLFITGILGIFIKRKVS